MNFQAIALVAVGFLVFGLLSKRLEDTPLTAPMFFTGFGVVLALTVPDAIGQDTAHGFIHTLAEITLVLVLFSDASRIDLAKLRADHNLPQRLLLIGMPLSIVLGTVCAALLFGQLNIWEAALLAAILVPTDAALGQAVVTSNHVPVRIRQTLNVESGLNDGIALPLVLLFAYLSNMMNESADAAHWLKFGALQIILGPLVGVLIGFTGARLVDTVANKDWISEAFEGIGALSIALLAFTCAELVHGNGFIAAFVAGLVFGSTLSHPCKFLYEFAETEGQLLTLTTFLIFGAVMIPSVVPVFQWQYVAYAALSLTVIRILPVLIALIGTGVNASTVAFLGWFGPRGLASILFALLIVEDIGVHNRQVILAIAVITVILSIVLHGMTAAPASRWYGQATQKLGECAENESVSELPYRVRTSRT